MRFALVDLGHTLRQRLHRLGQLIALNEALHPDLSLHERGEVSGIWVVEVRYLGQFNHQLLVIVGNDAMASPLLTPHVERQIAPSALIDFDVAASDAQRPVLATCRVPDLNLMYDQSELACIRAGRLVPRDHNIMNHVARLRMCLYIVTSSLRNVNGVPKQHTNSINAFSIFWALYNGGGDVFKEIHPGELQRSVELWTNRVAPDASSKPPVLLPNALDEDERAELWPILPSVAPRSRTESTPSVTDPILKIAEKLDQRIDDMERLWKVALGSELGGIWSDGPSPARRLYFGARDTAAARW